MYEKINQLQEILSSPDYENAILFLLMMNKSDHEFKAAAVPLATDPFIELAKSHIGKVVFKTTTPKLGPQEFMELPTVGLVHGAMQIEGCNVIFLFFRQQDQGVAAIYKPDGTRSCLRLTKLKADEAAHGKMLFVPNEGSVN